MTAEFDYTFDPTQDWPPHGAQVVAVGFTATFDCESDAPVGWHLNDGRYARPFDSLGRLLAQHWAANPQMEDQ